MKRDADKRNMAYNEKYRERAVMYKDKGHTFKQLKETFGITSSTYYKWRENKETFGFYVVQKKEPATRRRKVDPNKLKEIVEKEPDLFLKEIAEKFGCSITSIHNRLKKLKITVKKRHLPTRRNQKKTEPNILNS